MKHTAPLTAIALASALALAGCAGGTEENTDAAASEAAAGSAPAGATSTAEASGSAAEISPEHDDADVMFAQMMIPHHRQAVDMSEILLAKEDVPAEVRDFAQQVIDAQGPEIQRMEAMLSTWGQEPTMSESGGSGGMDHGDHGGMSGMMGEEDMQALQDAQGTEAARLYLEQMTAHHRGAVEMARDEADNGQNPQAVALAQDVISAQEAEITRMEQLLQELPSRS